MTSFITPTLPQPVRSDCPARIVCGRKPRRRPKNPSPPQTRPLPVLPPLPAIPPQATPPVTERAPPECSKSLIKTLQARRDAMVISATPHSPIVTALSCRDNSEHTLIVLPTRTAALQVANLLSDPDNRPKQSRQTRVIVAAGKGIGTWKHAAMNANSSKHSVIVVGTPRAMMNEFFNSHGLPWMGRVRFLVVACVGEMLKNGCGRDLYKVVRRVGTRRKTVLIENDFSDDVKKISDGWLREKHDVIQWGGLVSKAVTKDASVVTAGARKCLEYVVNIVDTRKKGDRVVILFCAARVLEVYATMLRVLGRNVIDIHSKSSMGSRMRGLEMFKDGGVLLGTDTVLEDVNDVDLVISMGAVEEGMYRKRLEIGKRGVVVVRPEIVEVMKFVGQVERWDGGDGCEIDDEVARKGVDEKARRMGYQALITVYAGWRRQLGWSRPQVVKFVNEWARELFGEVPEVERKFAGRRRLMGYEDVRVKQVVATSR